jgi:hypothetical protein
MTIGLSRSGFTPIRRGRSLDQRLELGRRIVNIRTDVLNVPNEQYSSNSLSIPETTSCVTANGPAPGRMRKPPRGGRYGRDDRPAIDAVNGPDCADGNARRTPDGPVIKVAISRQW